METDTLTSWETAQIDKFLSHTLLRYNSWFVIVVVIIILKNYFTRMRHKKFFNLVNIYLNMSEEYNSPLYQMIILEIQWWWWWQIFDIQKLKQIRIFKWQYSNWSCHHHWTCYMYSTSDIRFLHITRRAEAMQTESNDLKKQACVVGLALNTGMYL